jgi:hypothetical protein
VQKGGALSAADLCASAEKSAAAERELYQIALIGLIVDTFVAQSLQSEARCQSLLPMATCFALMNAKDARRAELVGLELRRTLTRFVAVVPFHRPESRARGDVATQDMFEVSGFSAWLSSAIHQVGFLVSAEPSDPKLQDRAFLRCTTQTVAALVAFYDNVYNHPDRHPIWLAQLLRFAVTLVQPASAQRKMLQKTAAGRLCFAYVSELVRAFCELLECEDNVPEQWQFDQLPMLVAARRSARGAWTVRLHAVNSTLSIHTAPAGGPGAAKVDRGANFMAQRRYS